MHALAHLCSTLTCHPCRYDAERRLDEQKRQCDQMSDIVDKAKGRLLVRWVFSFDHKCGVSHMLCEAEREEGNTSRQEVGERHRGKAAQAAADDANGKRELQGRRCCCCCHGQGAGGGRRTPATRRYLTSLRRHKPSVTHRRRDHCVVCCRGSCCPQESSQASAKAEEATASPRQCHSGGDTQPPCWGQHTFTGRHRCAGGCRRNRGTTDSCSGGGCSLNIRPSKRSSHNHRA